MKSNFYRVSALALSVLFGATIAAALVSAATTISTNIQTDGTLSVTGTSAFVGNVGIGSTSPAYPLSVVVADGGSIPTNNSQLFIQHTAAAAYPYAGISLDHHDSAAGNQGGTFINFSNNNVREALIEFDANLGVTDSFSIQNTTVDGPIVFQTGGANERMRISSGGAVGIGVTAPTASLEIATSSSNATTTVAIGKAGQNKGSCLVMYDVTGAVQYVTIQSGVFVVSSVSCK